MEFVRHKVASAPLRSLSRKRARVAASSRRRLAKSKPAAASLIDCKRRRRVSASHRIERLCDHRDGAEPSNRSRSAGGARPVMKITESWPCPGSRAGAPAAPGRHARHQHVEDDQFGPPARHRSQSFRTAGAAHHREFGIEIERELDHVAHQGIVIDMQNTIRLHTGTRHKRSRIPGAVLPRQHLIFRGGGARRSGRSRIIVWHARARL